MSEDKKGESTSAADQSYENPTFDDLPPYEETQREKDGQDSAEIRRKRFSSEASESMSVDDYGGQIVPHGDIAVIAHNNIGYRGKIKRTSNINPMHTIAEIHDDDDHKELILKTRKTLPMKNFYEEVRAHRDLKKFLVQPVVLLDVDHTTLEMIVESLLDKLKKDLEVDEIITSRAGKGFFTFHRPDIDPLASVDQLRETIQGVRYGQEGTVYEESWVTALCSLPGLKRSHVGIARLSHPLNLGLNSEEITFVICIIAPKKEKFTKNAVEIGRTFSSLMSNLALRKELSDARTEEDFKRVLREQYNKYSAAQSVSSAADMLFEEHDNEDEMGDYPFYHFGRGLYNDFQRRIPHLWSDIVDGFVGKHTIQKVISTTFFLYFACLLPDIAFGKLYEENTKGVLGVANCLMSQAFGGLIFALFGGQPMLIMLTTAPLALYVKVIYMVSDQYDLDFRAMYGMVGIWNSVFLFLQSGFNASKMMKSSTRSTEEIFAFFIALAFTGDAVKETIINFDKNYHFEGDFNETLIKENSTNHTLPKNCITEYYCTRPENSVLFLFLMFGTLWLGISLFKFQDSQFLSATKRVLLSDYALFIAVVCFSFIGSYLFRRIELEPFSFDPDSIAFNVAPVNKLSVGAVFAAAGLGLCLSCLFFVDQNVSAALVNAPCNKLKKGSAYHWDLMVVGVINLILSIFGLPWIHAALPHSPLHVRALADVEQHVTNFGTVHDEIVRVRETRVTGIVSSIMIGLSLLILQYLTYLPVAVLQGLFLYLALTSFTGNQLFDRLMLIFTEGSSYPPNHYVRKVPQRKLHLFTFCQVVQLAIVAGFGFAPQFYLKMVFPVLILFLIPIRHKLLPLIVEHRYLNVLDSD